MIHEYAVEPEAVARWERFRYFMEKFGFEEGRVLARFPKKWQRLVYEACCSRHDATDLEIKRIEEALRADGPFRLRERLVFSGREWDNGLPWIDNARASHNMRRFQAIIATTVSKKVHEELGADDVTDSHPLWHVERSRPVARRAADIAACIAPFLPFVRRLLMVDPHFDPCEPRYTRVLRGIMKELGIANLSRSEPRLSEVEYHASLRNPLSVGVFQENCKRSLTPLVPMGARLRVVLWGQPSGGDAFHGRYVLTERGGINIEHGLDEDLSGSATTDVSLLGRELWQKRWNQFTRVDPPRPIGECTVLPA